MRVVSTRAAQHQVVVSTAFNAATTKGIKTETYEVRDTTMLATMKPGDVISADVVMSGRQPYLENVSKESAQPQTGTGIVPSTDTVGMSGARGSTFGHDTTIGRTGLGPTTTSQDTNFGRRAGIPPRDSTGHADSSMVPRAR